MGAAHFGAGLIGCEHPFDAGAGGVSLRRFKSEVQQCSIDSMAD
jgi:hypothetical protein